MNRKEMIDMAFYDELIKGLFEKATTEEPVTPEQLIEVLNTESPKHVVPKNTLLQEQAKVREYKDTVKSLETKIQEGSSNEQLLSDLQAQVDTFKANEAKRERDEVIGKAIADVKGNEDDKEYILYLLGDVDLNDQTALTNRLKDLKTERPKLFASDEPEQVEEPKQPDVVNGYKVVDNGQPVNTAKTEEENLAAQIAKGFGF